MSHVPSHWDSLVDRLQHFNYTADLPRGGIASCRSNPNNGQQLGLGALFVLTDFF